MANRDSKFNAGIIFGAVVGAVAAYFLTPRTGKENRELFKKKIQDLNKMLEEHGPQETVKLIYGEVTEQGKQTYNMAREEMDTRLTELKKSVDVVDTEKYKSIVDDVINRVKDETNESVDRLSKLRAYFMDRFTDTKSEAKSDAKKVTKTAAKAATTSKKEDKVVN